MRSLSSAVVLLLILLRIAYGSTEEGEELPSSASTPTAERRSGSGECTQEEDCLRELCSRLVRLCRRETDCNPRIADCFNLEPKFFDGSYTIETPAKRSSNSRNSYFFMKLHPVLNRAVDASLMKVPTRYRRIGVRLGSEFLGKRSEGGGGGGREAGKARRGRKFQGTELLGKRYGSEMLGKRGVEFLGKRGNEFLGKRGNEFLGKRGNEFLGKRGNEFLGKRNRDGEDSIVKRFPSESNLLVQYLKVIAGSDFGNPERGFRGMSDSPNRIAPAQLNHNPLYLLKKLQMS